MTEQTATAPAPVPEPEPAAPRRRGSAWLPLLTAVLSMVLAMLVGAVLIVLTDSYVRESAGYFFARPSDTLYNAWYAVSQAYGWLFKGAIFDPATIGHGGRAMFGPLSETIVYATPVILTALSVALAFRTGLFNIGAQGQMIIGASLAAWLGFHYDLPVGVHLILCLLGGLIGGAIYGGIAGLLKATTGAHEVIVTIMFNWIALKFLAFLLATRGFQAPPYNEAKSLRVDDSALLPKLFFDLRWSWAIFLSLAAALAVWWILERTTIGFRLKAVGANPAAARTAGMSAGRAYIVAMAGAGMLAGLAGATQVLGTTATVTGTIDNNAGFDGITAALLGRGKPLGCIAAGLLFGALRAGGQRMASETGAPIDLVVVIQALTVLFIAAPALIKAIFRLPTAESLGTTSAKGWGA